MIYESNVLVAEDLAVVIVPKNELDDFNKELRAFGKRLEKNCKPYNNRRTKPIKRIRGGKYVASVCNSAKWRLDLIPIMLVLATFFAGEVLQLDCGSLDKLLYILAAYSQTVISRPKKRKL